MPVIYQSKILRADLRANRKILYAFGDNDERYGLGGQAKEMRGEPNARGIRTKRSPGGIESSYWTDNKIQENVRKILNDLTPIQDHLARGGIVVLPIDDGGEISIGAGRAKMKQMCPQTYAVLRNLLIGLGEKLLPPRLSDLL